MDVQRINSSSPLSDYALICSDIQSLLRKVKCVSCSFILRGGNKVAHLLISFALRHLIDMFWVESCRVFISLVVLDDLVLT